MSEPINALVQAAGAAAHQGRWNEAEQLWRKVLAVEPRHPQALWHQRFGPRLAPRGQG